MKAQIKQQHQEHKPQEHKHHECLHLPQTPMVTQLNLRFLRRGVCQVADDDRPRFDATLIVGLARAFYWQSLIDTQHMDSGSAIARAEGLDQSVVNEALRWTLLAPDIVELIMTGRQPKGLTLMWLQRHRIVSDWQAQREMIANIGQTPKRVQHKQTKRKVTITEQLTKQKGATS